MFVPIWAQAGQFASKDAKNDFEVLQPLQDYHEVKIILRVPRTQQPAGAVRAAESSSSGGASLPETAVGVNGIELREQTHEEALLSTIGNFLAQSMSS